MSIVTLSTVTIVSKVTSAIRRRFMTAHAVPFTFCVACGGTVSRDGVIYYATQFDGARPVVQIVLIVAVAVLTREALLFYVPSMRACIWRAIMTVGTV